MTTTYNQLRGRVLGQCERDLSLKYLAMLRCQVGLKRRGKEKPLKSLRPLKYQGLAQSSSAGNEKGLDTTNQVVKQGMEGLLPRLYEMQTPRELQH